MMSSASTGELPVPRNTGKQGNRHETVIGKDFISVESVLIYET